MSYEAYAGDNEVAEVERGGPEPHEDVPVAQLGDGRALSEDERVEAIAALDPPLLLRGGDG